MQVQDAILDEEPLEILEKFDSLSETQISQLFERFCGPSQPGDSQAELRQNLTQELTRLTAKLELESQEILASEPGNPSNGEESEGLSDARNADEEQSDTESE